MAYRVIVARRAGHSKDIFSAQRLRLPGGLLAACTSPKLEPIADAVFVFIDEGGTAWGQAAASAGSESPTAAPTSTAPHTPAGSAAATHAPSCPWTHSCAGSALRPALRPKPLKFLRQGLDFRRIRLLGGLGLDQGRHRAMDLCPKFCQRRGGSRRIVFSSGGTPGISLGGIANAEQTAP